MIAAVNCCSPLNAPTWPVIGIQLEEVVLLDEPRRAVLVLEDDEVIVAVEVKLLLQFRGAGDVVGRIDLFHDDVLAAGLLVFLEQVGDLVGLAGALLGSRKV